MTTDKRTARSIFLVAVENHPPEQWKTFLDGACAGDSDLRAHVEVLLQGHVAPNSLLDHPSPELFGMIDASITERSGTVVGAYKLLEQIGEGGFGVVFMAEQQQPVRRKVALKVLKPGMDTRQVIARFEAERQALALMDHPNIAHVFDGGETATGRPYFVMELVRGIPITDFCDQNHLPIRERLDLFVSVCQAAQHAHQKGIIHRDVKPSNVLVTLHDDKAVPKIIDFGIAKATGQQLTEKTLFTNFAQMIGTPLYMSPEQAQMSGLDIDTRTDIYALGVLLYELLTGTTPLTREHFEQIAYDEMRRIIREEEPPKPSTRISTLGQAATTLSAQRKSDPRRLSQLIRGELDWIVMKCLEKDRNRRYESASGLARDVERHLRGEPVQACPPSAWYRWRKLVWRHRTALTIAGSFLVFIVALGCLLGWVARDREARDREATHDREVREAALDEEVSRLLDGAAPFVEQGKWSEALAVVDRADKLLASAGRLDRPPRLLDLRHELSVAVRLEDIYRNPARETMVSAEARGKQVSAEMEFFTGQGQDARFAAAFRDLGIDLQTLEPAEASACIRRAGIRQALIRGIDEWAAMRGRWAAIQSRDRGGPDDPFDDSFWGKLIEVARHADPDDWRDNLRKALLQRDRRALEKLADSASMRALPPSVVYLLAYALRDLGAGAKAIALLEASHRLHPDDFWLNDTLGYFSHTAIVPPRLAEALRYHTAALAIRPQSVDAHVCVASVLLRMNRSVEALTEYSRAIELDPSLWGAWVCRGEAYGQLGQWREAIADCSKSIELFPNPRSLAWSFRAYYHSILGQWEKAAADLAVHFRNGSLSPGDDIWFQLACLRLLNDDVSGYCRLSRQLVDSVLLSKKDITGQTGYMLCRTCLLLPEDETSLARTMHWAEQTLARSPGAAWYLHVMALAYYRAGQFDRAERHCCLCQGAGPWDGRAASKLLLALTLKRLHREEPARKAIRELVQWREAIHRGIPTRIAATPPKIHLSDWLEFQVLWHEAEKVFDKSELSAPESH
jgi:serine/threonine-protein kinase